MLVVQRLFGPFPLGDIDGNCGDGTIGQTLFRQQDPTAVLALHLERRAGVAVPGQAVLYPFFLPAFGGRIQPRCHGSADMIFERPAGLDAVNDLGVDIAEFLVADTRRSSGPQRTNSLS